MKLYNGGITMGAIIKTSDEKIREMIEETSKKTATLISEENAKKTATLISEENAKQNAILKLEIEEAKKSMTIPSSVISESISSSTGSKVSQILKNANLQQSIKSDENSHAGHNHSDDVVDCPTCRKPGHVLKSIGHGKVACTGPNCGDEYALISTKPDYKCTTCGLPHKRPIGNEENDDCPMCGNTNFLKYDWSKIIKPSKKS
jgi:hypothetical protein